MRLDLFSATLSAISIVNLFSVKTFFPGLDSEGETPVPIPNTAVKPFSANGTARGTVWESRSTPG